MSHKVLVVAIALMSIAALPAAAQPTEGAPPLASLLVGVALIAAGGLLLATRRHPQATEARRMEDRRLV